MREDMIEELETIRCQYKPDQVRVLFIGESPPCKQMSGKQDFFYFGRGLLFDATWEAFNQFDSRLFCRKDRFLDQFRGLGCYLDDLSQKPITCLSDREKCNAREAGIVPLSKHIREYRPLAFVVVIKQIEEWVNEALKEADFPAINPAYLHPFPRSEYKKRYMAGIKKNLRFFTAKGTLELKGEL